MARWSRSRLRTFGAAAVVLVGGSLLIIPAVSQAGEEPARVVRKPVTAAAAPDRIAMIPGRDGHSAFEFQPGSGDRTAPFTFVSAGGTVRVRQLGETARKDVQARTGAPVRAAKVAADATTYSTTLTVQSDNWTAWNKTIGLWNRDTWTYVPVTNPQNSLSATVSLPPGNYYATAMYGIYDVDSYLLTRAFTVTSKAQTVTLAETSAKEVALTVDDSTARPDMSAVWMSLPNGDLVGFAGGPRTRTYVTTASVAGPTLRAHEVLIKAGSSALKPTPYRYDLVNSWAHPLPASLIRKVTTASLAKTSTTIRAQGATADGSYMTVPNAGEWTGVFLPTAVRVPAAITEYVTPGVSMSRIVSYDNGDSLSLSDRTLTAGSSAGEIAGSGPLVPSRRPYNDDSRREANQLQITENMTLGDAAGNKGADTSSATTMTLSSGGQVLKTANAVGMTVDVPADQQTYRLDQTTTRSRARVQLSTKIRSEWTFTSAAGPHSALLPLMDLGVAASGLDQRNRAGSEPVRLTVQPSTRQNATASQVDSLEWSADDGATWTGLPLTATDGGVEASLDVPATAAFVSLRMTASNDHGGALRRTVLRALAGPAVPGDEAAGGTTISDLVVNGGKPLVVGTSGAPELTATFTATDPSGIAGAGLYLWHGDYLASDGLQTARTECVPVDATSSTCTAYLYIWDVRYSLANVLAGTWWAAAWATAKDGTGFADRHSAGVVTLKRNTGLTTNAFPEPVKRGKTETVTGALIRADWDTWAYRPFPSAPVTLQLNPRGTTKWTRMKTVTSDAAGKLRTTLPATGDGSYRYVFAGDAGSNPVTSAADYIDVQ